MCEDDDLRSRAQPQPVKERQVVVYHPFPVPQERHIVVDGPVPIPVHVPVPVERIIPVQVPVPVPVPTPVPVPIPVPDGLSGCHAPHLLPWGPALLQALLQQPPALHHHSPACRAH